MGVSRAGQPVILPGGTILASRGNTCRAGRPESSGILRCRPSGHFQAVQAGALGSTTAPWSAPLEDPLTSLVAFERGDAGGTGDAQGLASEMEPDGRRRRARNRSSSSQPASRDSWPGAGRRTPRRRNGTMNRPESATPFAQFAGNDLQHLVPGQGGRSRR